MQHVPCLCSVSFGEKPGTLNARCAPNTLYRLTKKNIDLNAETYEPSWNLQVLCRQVQYNVVGSEEVTEDIPPTQIELVQLPIPAEDF